jgi:hypothetical protein
VLNISIAELVAKLFQLRRLLVVATDDRFRLGILMSVSHQTGSSVAFSVETEALEQSMIQLFRFS